MYEILSAILVFGLPLTFFILFFIGIVTKKKRLWVTSLIFLIIIVIAEFTWFTPVKETKIEYRSAQPN